MKKLLATAALATVMLASVSGPVQAQAGYYGYGYGYSYAPRYTYGYSYAPRYAYGSYYRPGYAYGYPYYRPGRVRRYSVPAYPYYGY